VLVLLGVCGLCVYLLAKRPEAEQDEPTTCALKDAVHTGGRSSPVALAVMPYSASVHLRVVIEKMTGYVTASTICDPDLKKSPGLKEECGNVDRAIACASAAPLKFGQGEREDGKSYSGAIFVARNPFDWIYQSYRTTHPDVNIVIVPEDYTKDAVAVYKRIFNYWSKLLIRKIMLRWEDLAESDIGKWNKLLFFLTSRTSFSRVSCALDLNETEKSFIPSFRPYTFEDNFSEASRAYVAQMLAEEICKMGYEDKLRTSVLCEERWTEARKQRELTDEAHVSTPNTKTA